MSNFGKSRPVTLLEKWRKNRSISVRQLRLVAHMSGDTIVRIERGEAVMREVLSRYFYALGFDLNKLERGDLVQGEEQMANIKIIDEGHFVRVESSQ